MAKMANFIFWLLICLLSDFKVEMIFLCLSSLFALFFRLLDFTLEYLKFADLENVIRTYKCLFF